MLDLNDIEKRRLMWLVEDKIEYWEKMEKDFITYGIAPVWEREIKVAEGLLKKIKGDLYGKS